MTSRRLVQPPDRSWFSLLLHPAAWLFMAALLIRGAILDWGLPYVEHPDEPAIIEVVVRMVCDPDLNPHRFVYPSLLYYMLAAVTRLHLWWGLDQGLYASAQDLPFHNFQFTIAPRLFVWARALTAVLGAGTVGLVFVLGQRMFDRRVGLLAALMLMMLPFHVEHSVYVTPDVPSGIWVLVSLLGAWGVVSTGRPRDYLVAGTAAGLAAGTKYQAGLVAGALVLAHVLYWQRQSIGRPFLRLLAGGLVALLSFMVTTPYAVLDWPAFFAGLRGNAMHYAAGGHGDFIGRWQLGEYGRFLWQELLFPPACAVALAGLPIVARRSGRQVLLLALVIVAVFVLLLSYSVNFVRNLVPVVGLLLLVAAAGTVALVELLPYPKLHWLGLLFLATCMLWPQVTRTAWRVRYWRQPHTMVRAAEAVHSLPRGLRIAAEIPEQLFTGDPVVFSVDNVTSHSLDWYRSNGFRYLIVKDERQNDEERRMYHELQANSSLVVNYPARRLGLEPGPGGSIVDLGIHPEALALIRHELYFNTGMSLLGYEMRPGQPRSRITSLGGAATRSLRRGESLQINLYWGASVRQTGDYTLVLHVLDAAGTRVAQRDLRLRHVDYPTSLWQPGELVVDSADISLPVLGSGEYRVLLGLYHETPERALLAMGPPAAGEGPLVPLTTFRVEAR